MAAAVKALNARIRANPVTDYLCSTRTFNPSESLQSSYLRMSEYEQKELDTHCNSYLNAQKHGENDWNCNDVQLSSTDKLWVKISGVLPPTSAFQSQR